MDYGDFKDLLRKTASDKVHLSKNPKYDGYQRGLASTVYNFLDKKSKGGGAINEIKQNEQLDEDLHKSILKKILKRRVFSSFKNNIWDADLADMQLISKRDKGIRFLLRVIDIFSKYAGLFL